MTSCKKLSFRSEENSTASAGFWGGSHDVYEMFMKCRTLLFLSLVLSLLVIMMGCEGGRMIIEDRPAPEYGPPVVEKGPPPWAPAHGRRAKYHYRYYPSSYVYFDVGRRLYFYYDAGNWRVAVSLPSRVQIDFDDYVTLGMDTDKPYKYHSEVVKRHPPGQQKKTNKGKHKKKW